MLHDPLSGYPERAPRLRICHEMGSYSCVRSKRSYRPWHWSSCCGPIRTQSGSPGASVTAGGPADRPPLSAGRTGKRLARARRRRIAGVAGRLGKERCHGQGVRSTSGEAGALDARPFEINLFSRQCPARLRIRGLALLERQGSRQEGNGRLAVHSEEATPEVRLRYELLVHGHGTGARWTFSSKFFPGSCSTPAR